MNMNQNQDRITGRLQITFIEGKRLEDKAWIGKQNPYCKFEIEGHKVKTKADKHGGREPQWNETLTMQLKEVTGSSRVLIECDSSEVISKARIGRIEMTLRDFFEKFYGKKQGTWTELYDFDDNQRSIGSLCLSVTWEGTDLKTLGWNICGQGVSGQQNIGGVGSHQSGLSGQNDIGGVGNKNIGGVGSSGLSGNKDFGVGSSGVGSSGLSGNNNFGGVGSSGLSGNKDFSSGQQSGLSGQKDFGGVGSSGLSGSKGLTNDSSFQTGQKDFGVGQKSGQRDVGGGLGKDNVGSLSHKSGVSDNPRV
jgi:Ca2+-dependent lipid-binding protein